MLKALRHENVVRLLDAFRRQDRLHLVFEYLEGTVLEALQQAPTGLGANFTRRLLWQLLKAVEHLHGNRVSTALQIKWSNAYKNTTGTQPAAKQSMAYGHIQMQHGGCSDPCASQMHESAAVHSCWNLEAFTEFR